MCGITGYVGKKEALPIVFTNLRKLEYRGYDSAGVAFFDFPKGKSTLSNAEGLRIRLIKAVGKMDNLEKAIAGEASVSVTAAIAHTRWATHGVPNEANAHPHVDCKEELFLVHNGIIENYQKLKGELQKGGHRFRSETDTEVAAHLIEEHGFEPALKKIVGTYAFAVVFKDQPEKLYFARVGSPLVIGIGDDGYYLASDPAALAGLVDKVIYLKDGQHGVLTPEGFKVGPGVARAEKLDMNPEQARKGDFPHFMIKEIFEAPEVIRATLRGRLNKRGEVELGGLAEIAGKMRKLKKLDILACGTSYYSGLVGKLLFEQFAGIPTEVMLASEYRYGDHPVRPGTGALFISQSGETADTLAALRKADASNNLTIGVVNVVGSSIARETDAGVYNQIGPEIGVASTKAFMSQLTVLALISSYFMPKSTPAYKNTVKELLAIPAKIQKILDQNDAIKALAKKYSRYGNFLYLGRGYNYPAALEGALKLKEITYLHAEGYAGGEMKHGPIALIDKNFPTVALVTKNRVYDKMISNIQEIRARSGPVLAVATEGDREIAKLVDDVIYVPKTEEALEPLLNIVPLQLFAYHVGVSRGYDVDKPRNLAKSVTVE